MLTAQGVAVFQSPSGCLASWPCVPDVDSVCLTCGDYLSPAPPSECCAEEVVVFSPHGPAQCAGCGLSPTYPIGVSWPSDVVSLELPAEWEDAAFSGEVLPGDNGDWLQAEGYRLVAVSPRRDLGDDGRFAAQYLFTKEHM